MRKCAVDGKMKVIGLTGNSGSGKGYVCSLFARHGIDSVDTDDLVHKMYMGKNACTDALRNTFGDKIFADDGSVDRRKLADIVFSDSKSLRVLNDIVHHHVKMQLHDILADCRKKGTTAVLIDAPMLFESGLDKDCDLTVAIVASHETLVERIVSRDGITREQARARLAAQKSTDFFIKNCDAVIPNDHGDDPERSVELFVAKYLTDHE